jgi:hypothetical protein
MGGGGEREMGTQKLLALDAFLNEEMTNGPL